jgi:uncharacterized protein (TIGR00661 family)
MAKIFYSMAGEGRGHAVRVRTLVEQLKSQHQFVLFASDQAYDFLAKFYSSSVTGDVRLVRIPGLRFHYTAGQLDLMKTLYAGAEYAWYDLGPLVRGFSERIEAEQPDLAIVDFEPALPRAANTMGLPWISLDHQQVLLSYDFSTLPADLQRYAWLMSHAVRWYSTSPTRTVASSFFTPPLKPGFEYVDQIGPLLRQEVSNAEVSCEPFILSYLRAETPRSVVDQFVGCGLPVKIYGLGEQAPFENITFHPLAESTFVADLASCQALISAAGNQLLGEASFLGKPILAIPELSHHEQLINAHFVKQMGAGEWVGLEELTQSDIVQFLSRCEAYRRPDWRYRPEANGTPTAMSIIEQELANSAMQSQNGSLVGSW